MNLTESNFCPYIENSSTPVRLMYLCKKTGKLCPQIEYNNGKPLPKTHFIKNGCPLNKKEEVKKKEIVKKEVTPTQKTTKKTTTQKKRKTNKK